MSEVKQMVTGTNLGRIQNKTMQRNNTSGCTGVSFHRGKGQWYARIRLQGKTYNLGYFDDIEDAIAARKKAEKQYFDGFIDHISRKKIIEM